MSDPRIQATLDYLVDLLSRDDLPDTVARTIIPPQQADIPSTHWSLGNRLLMVLQGTEDARGYRQWAQVERHPIKGARAFYIWAPASVAPIPQIRMGHHQSLAFIRCPCSASRIRTVRHSWT